MARSIILASLFAIGLVGGAQAASDVLLSGGGDDNTIAYSGTQLNIAGGGTAGYVGGGEYGSFSHTGDWPGQGNRSAALDNASGSGSEPLYAGSVAPAPAKAAIGAPR